MWPFLEGEILKDLIPQVGLRIKFGKQFALDQSTVVENSDISSTEGKYLDYIIPYLHKVT